MANKFLGEVTAEGDGKTFTLRCDFNAMCWFEEATGENALKVFEDFEGVGISASMMRKMMLAFLQHHHPDATANDAGNILSADVNALARLMQAATPTPEENGVVGKQKAVKAKAA